MKASSSSRKEPRNLRPRQKNKLGDGRMDAGEGQQTAVESIHLAARYHVNLAVHRKQPARLPANLRRKRQNTYSSLLHISLETATQATRQNQEFSNKKREV